MKYRHLIALGGDSTTGLFAFDSTSASLEASVAAGRKMAADLAFTDMYHSIGLHGFRTDAPTVQSVIDYDPYFEQFEFMPTWKAFLDKMHEWQKVPVTLGGKTLEA